MSIVMMVRPFVWSFPNGWTGFSLTALSANCLNRWALSMVQLFRCGYLNIALYSRTRVPNSWPTSSPHNCDRQSWSRAEWEMKRKWTRPTPIMAVEFINVKYPFELFNVNTVSGDETKQNEKNQQKKKKKKQFHLQIHERNCNLSGSPQPMAEPKIEQCELSPLLHFLRGKRMEKMDNSLNYLVLTNITASLFISLGPGSAPCIVSTVRQWGCHGFCNSLER